MDLKPLADQIIKQSIAAVQPAELFRRQFAVRNGRCFLNNKDLRLENYGNIFVIGAGKASAAMAVELEKLLGSRIAGGSLSVKYGHGADCRRINVMEAAHPVPDLNGLSATAEILH
ncbi:MAG: DUF4147 domain-containing protein, partial [Calditrichia bacterium]